MEISNQIKDILTPIMIGDWKSEPHQQHQKPAKRKYQDVKHVASTLMDCTGLPAFTWLLALMYVCFALNFTASAALDRRTPLKF